MAAIVPTRLKLQFLLPLSAALSLYAGCSPARQAVSLDEEPVFAGSFLEAGCRGTFVLYDPVRDRYLVYDRDRAERRFVPASTFKVLNALISLETGVVADTSVVFAWDGIEREISPWNRDHSLTSAIRYSVVWYFQELARRVGEERMREYVQRAEYGNADIGGGIDRFWLTGDLRISAIEQVEFLRRLHERELPFSEATVAAVEAILVEERGDGYVLRAKSGWADSVPADIGWYVGYVERSAGTYYFALNIDIEQPEQGAQRRAIARRILAEHGILE